MENSGPPSPEEGANDNIEAVRDLLFGKRTAEISGRIAETEHSLKDAIQRMEAEVANKFVVLESIIGDKLNSLETRIGTIDDRLKSEAVARIQHGENLRKSFDQTETLLTDRMNSLEERVHNFETRIWNDLHSLAKKQSEDMTVLRSQLFAKLETEIAVLAEKSINPGELGDFFIDMGLKMQPASETSNRGTPDVEAQPGLAG